MMESSTMEGYYNTCGAPFGTMWKSPAAIDTMGGSRRTTMSIKIYGKDS
jgi:hypothetical protein